MNSSIVERIKKLLSLANSDNANERDLALAKAHALATEHQIDLSQVSSVEAAPEAFVKEEDGSPVLRAPIQQKFVHWILQRHFRVDLVTSSRYSEDRGRRVHVTQFIGRVSDVALARWMHSYLQEEFARRWREYKALNGAAEGLRNTYFLGLYNGLNSKLTEARKEAEAARFSAPNAQQAPIPGVDVAPASDRRRYEVALVDETKARESAVSRFFPRLRHTRSAPVVSRSHAVSSDGFTAGRSISLNRPLAA